METDHSKFYQLLETILSIDNALRTEAEKTYNDLNIEIKLSNLLAVLHDGNLKEDARMMGAVLLRRLFTASFEDFHKLPPEAQAQFKQKILLSIQQDISSNLRQKICEVIAELARNMLDDDQVNHWPDVLQFLFQCSNCNSNDMRESALRIFTAVPDVFGNQETQYQTLIFQMLAQSVDVGASPKVQFQAVRAICAYVFCHAKNNNYVVIKQFVPLMPRVINILADSINSQEDQTLLKLIIEMTETCPKLLRPNLDLLFELCLKVFSDSDFEDSWRHLALEVIVSMSENAAPIVRKLAMRHVVKLLPYILQMMTDLDDDQNWSVTEELSEDDNSENNVIAESALDRIACGLGGKAILPHILAIIPKMLSDTDWKQRHAALMAISAIGEGCRKQLLPMLDDVMAGVLKFLTDPHPRVRFAACNAIGQMSTDFAPNFEKKFHEQVVPGLLNLLDDVHNPRVQAHAGAALVNFSEDCPKYILTKYLDDIMNKLELILTTKFKELVEVGTKMVLEQVVTTIASVADTSEKDFAIYYDRLMPYLKYIVENGTTEELRMLRGKTIECVSLIGLAVGQEKFANDANDVMKLLLATQVDGELADDDPQTSYLISAWARMCKILGKQFEQYLPMVMGPVMRTAAMKPEVAFLDNEEAVEIQDDQEWSCVSLGEQQHFAIRTSGMEEKAAACEMLVCYARELKEGFVEFAEDVVKLMVPMLKFYFHDGVRSAAAESLPYLLECAKIRGPSYLEGMWAYICPELIKAIGSEPELNVIATEFQSLAQIVETLGPNCFSTESLAEVLRLVAKYLDDHFDKSNSRALARQEEDYDEAVEDKLADEDQVDIYLLSKMSELLHSLFKTNGVNFMPHFDMLIEHVRKLLDPARSWSDRQWGLCIFDDVIEYTGPMCTKYQHIFLIPLFEFIFDESPEVRQAAAYGVGVLAQFGGEEYANTCAEFTGRLHKIISAENSRSAENINPTENCIAAVTKILKYNRSGIPNIDEVIAAWFEWLPVIEDADEAQHVYEYFSDLIEANHPVILGENNSNIPKIVSIIAEAFATCMVKGSDTVGQRLVNIIKLVETNSDVFQLCLSVLNAEQKAAVEEAYRDAAQAASSTNSV